MCHLYYIQFKCGHKTMVKLFCHQEDLSALCEPPQQRTIGVYRYGGRCRDCAVRLWDTREGNQNEAIDDEYEQIEAQRDELATTRSACASAC